ncbi:MAG TPA: ComEC/Rec2 family competence protein, partial [Cellvibrio sp.]
MITLGWLLTGILLTLIACMRQRTWFLLFALGGGMIVGYWRGGLEQSVLDMCTPLYGKVITLKGTVSDDADVDKQGDTVLRLKDIMIENRHLSGAVWVVLSNSINEIERSDRIAVTGKLQQGFGTFAGTMYRAEPVKIERPEPGDIALHVRDWFAGAVRQAIPEPESSLGVGYLVGQRRNLPEDLDAALKVAGLTHIVVASGYNLTILVRLARRLFERISKYLATLVSGGLIVSFIAVTGISPSMSRAGLVAGLSLAAWYYGRKFHPLILLAIVAAVTVLVNPYYAWGDVGWQLSFAAFAGVMIFAPVMQAFYFGKKKPGTLRQILGETVSATILTAPILLYSFGQISNVAVFANLLIL